MSAADFVCGLDLGRAVDYTAAAVLRRRWEIGRA